MSGPVNNSPGDISQIMRDAIRQQTGEPTLDADKIMQEARKATDAFAKVTAGYASEAGQKKSAGNSTTLDPHAPELKEPEKNAVKNAINQAANGKDSQKTDTAPDKAQKQPVQQEMTARNMPQETAARSQGQMPSRAARDSQDPATLAGNANEDAAADKTDNNQLTKYVGTNTKANQNTARDEKNPGQQSKALLQDPTAKNTRLATDAQSATNAAQGGGGVAKAIIEDAKDLQDLNESMLALTEGTIADGSGDEQGSSASMTGKAAATMFFGIVLQMVNENTIDNMMAKINALLANADAASTAFQDQYDEINGMQSENDVLKQQLEAEKSTLADLEAASKAAAAAAAAANPPDPALQAKADQAAAAVTAQNKVVSGLISQIAINESKIAGATVKFYNELAAYNSLNKNMTTALQQSSVSSLNNKGMETLAILMMLQQADKNALDALNEAAKKRKLIQEAEAASADKKAADAIESKRKADAMGCLAKLIAAIVTIVSFAAALFTGGASLIFASIAMAILVVDTALQLAGKKTLTDTFMEKVMKPIVDALAKGLEALLTKLFGDQPWIKAASQAIAMVVVAVAMIAAMAAGMSAASSAMGSIAGPLAKAASQSAVTTINQAAKVAQIAGAGIALPATQITGAVYNAKTQISLSELQLMTDRAMKDMIERTERETEHYKALRDLIQSVTDSFMSAAETTMSTGKSILKSRPIAS